MSEEMKEVVRLLFECVHELQLHDRDYKHQTSEQLKTRLAEFLRRNNIDDAETAANELVRQSV